MAAARRAAATRPSPGAPPLGGQVPRAVRRLPPGHIAAVPAVPAVDRATTTVRVPRVAVTGLPGVARPEGPGPRRVALAVRAVVPATAVAARTAPGTLAGRRGAARVGPARIRRTPANLAGPGTATTTAGPVARDATPVRPRAVPAGGMTARARHRGTARVAAARRPGAREAATAVLTGPGTGTPARARIAATVRGTAAAVPTAFAGPAVTARARGAVRRAGREAPAGHRTHRGMARGAAAAPAGPGGLRIRGAVTVPAAGPASAAARGAVPARVAPAARTAIATPPPAARAGMTRPTPAVAGRAIVTTRPGPAGTAMTCRVAAATTRPAGARSVAGQATGKAVPGRTARAVAGLVAGGMTGRTAAQVMAGRAGVQPGQAVIGRTRPAAGLTGRTGVRVLAGRAGLAGIVMM